MNQVPFQTPNLVWDSTIAIYLFLLGVASGTTILALLYKRSRKLINPSENWIIRSTAIIAPSAVIIGLTLLIFHLTRPWTFWFLMFNYQFNSVMSMGVLMFQVYMTVMFLWIVIIFRDLIANRLNRFLPRLSFINRWIQFVTKFIQPIEWFLLFLGVVLGVYTGFLLSDLISYPMLNNRVLPWLFLASGTSSGIATLLITILTVGRLTPHSDEAHFLHKIERPTVAAEIILLVIFFAVLYMAGGQSEVAANNALSGFWGMIFWVGVVGVGLCSPQIASLVVGSRYHHHKAFIVVMAVASLIGVVCLRYFILYAGQLTIA
ncbi:respiratory nitrite reductase-specific menaquinol--cytochrome-c reductase complex subunit NrfD [Nicoletella semolina]|uniref:Respiratory nitrite reductase-specific menaquinol--cytochrome-c reductase complex subunit NrfD n=1 Tax=Nicoletella semolina TaxID=271160 RepID=A0A4R2N8X6_9PAST|nr:cytochrome c nitrite reductase subunit NrfD [Nicoletella semolina]MDH2924494.1 cytochrome c nitrite reductase subunit NrfD [Nicoletella semolina]TCP17378.1 respiratory nitrite reductase-specific menaquinol--cytochrome-c reductase complex subunit NrfD [Nicoletella semolina]